jgi:hypothetical protein
MRNVCSPGCDTYTKGTEIIRRVKITCREVVASNKDITKKANKHEMRFEYTFRGVVQ